MKLCFVCNEYPPAAHGGIGSVIRILGRALVRNGRQVRVIGVYPRPTADSYEEDEGVRVWRLQSPGVKFGWILARYRLFKIIANWVRNGEVNLIEVPDYQGCAAGWRPLAAPVICRLHGSSTYFADEMGWPLSRKEYLLERASLRRCGYYCSTSQYTATKTQKLFGLRTAADCILYNPVEAPALASSRTRSKNQVVFTGTLNEKKGIISLIRAWPMVTEACPEAELHIFGKDGLTGERKPMQAYLQSQLNGERDSVHFHGHTPREELLANLRIPRVAVFPSYSEAFAMAPLEAMAQGCPTINSKRGSGPELIQHNQQGLLVDPGNPREIADAIIRLLRDDELAARLGQAGQRRIQDAFSLPKLVARNEAFFESCISRWSARASR
jgi:glycosyltransferase involved in cell wall biosynthesis